MSVFPEAFGELVYGCFVVEIHIVFDQIHEAYQESVFAFPK